MLSACSLETLLKESEERVDPVFRVDSLNFLTLASGTYAFQVSPDIELTDLEAPFSSHFPTHSLRFTNHVKRRLVQPLQARPNDRLNIQHTLKPTEYIALPDDTAGSRCKRRTIQSLFADVSTDYLIDVQQITLQSDTSDHRFLLQTRRRQVIGEERDPINSGEVRDIVTFKLSIWDTRHSRLLMSFHFRRAQTVTAKENLLKKRMDRFLETMELMPWFVVQYIIDHASGKRTVRKRRGRFHNK